MARPVETARPRTERSFAWALARALALTAGAAGLRRGLPVYVGLFAVGGLLFGGNGLTTATVVEGAQSSTAARALMWCAWLIVMTPTLAGLWQASSSFWLRSLPVARAWHLAILLAFSGLAESLWAIVWGFGGGPVMAAGALGGALAGHGVVLARPAGALGVAAVVATVAGLVLAPPPVLAVATWPIGLVTLRSAWLAAPTRSAAVRGATRAWPGPLMLASALALGVVRGQATVLARGALTMALATAAAWLAARTNQVSEAAELQIYLCGFMVPAGLVAGSAASGPMLHVEQAAQWLLTTTGASPRTRLGAMALALLGLGAGLGAASGLALALAKGVGTIRLVAAGAAAGGSLVVFAGLAARWAARFGTRGPGRLVLALLLAATLALAGLAWFAATAVFGWTAATLMTWWIGHARSGRPKAAATGGAMVPLEMVGVRKRLGTRIVLEAVDLSCRPGEVTLLLGENGAGKSTLLRIAAGIVEPDRGTVRVAGMPLTGGGAAGRRALGYAPDTADAFPELAVRELLALVAALKQAPPPDQELCARLGLTPVMDQRMRTLSFGQVKRTYLAAATIGSPQLWLFDEPSNGLDPEGGALVATLLREHAEAGGAALVTTNDARFVSLCEGRRVRLQAGALREEA